MTGYDKLEDGYIEIQLEYLEKAYENQKKSSSALDSKASLYLTTIGLVVGIFLFKFDTFFKSSITSVNQEPTLLVIMYTLLLIILLFTILAILVFVLIIKSRYYKSPFPKNLVSQWLYPSRISTKKISCLSFKKMMLERFAVATDENWKVNSKRNKLLKRMSFFVSIILVAFFLLLLEISIVSILFNRI